MVVPEKTLQRLERIERTILDQKNFMVQVPDPDNRILAEVNLMTLVGMRQTLEAETFLLETRLQRSRERPLTAMPNLAFPSIKAV